MTVSVAALGNTLYKQQKMLYKPKKQKQKKHIQDPYTHPARSQGMVVKASLTNDETWKHRDVCRL